MVNTGVPQWLNLVEILLRRPYHVTKTIKSPARDFVYDELAHEDFMKAESHDEISGPRGVMYTLVAKSPHVLQHE